MKKLVISLILLMAIPCFADTIFLKNGQKVEGKLLEKVDDTIKIEFYDMILSFHVDEIESIEKEIPAIITKTEKQKEELTKKLLEKDVVDVIYDIKAVPKKKSKKKTSNPVMKRRDFVEMDESGVPLPNTGVVFFTAPEDNPHFQVKDPSEETEEERKRREAFEKFNDER